MTDYKSEEEELKNQSYKDQTVLYKYSFNYNLIKIVDLTIHTVRQSWILLKESLPYCLDSYLKEGSEYPDFEEMNRYVRFSSLAYIAFYSVGTVICQVTKPDLPANPSKSPFSSKTSKSKQKPDQFSVVIVALSVLPNHSGIGLSLRLLDYTIDRVKEAKLSKLYALADENMPNMISFYKQRGFTVSSSTFSEVLDSLKVEQSKSGLPPSFVFMETSLQAEPSK